MENEGTAGFDVGGVPQYDKRTLPQGKIVSGAKNTNAHHPDGI
jgi:hypothetical protein